MDHKFKKIDVQKYFDDWVAAQKKEDNKLVSECNNPDQDSKEWGDQQHSIFSGAFIDNTFLGKFENMDAIYNWIGSAKDAWEMIEFAEGSGRFDYPRSHEYNAQDIVECYVETIGEEITKDFMKTQFG